MLHRVYVLSCVLILFLAGACGRRVAVRNPQVPAHPEEALYKQGLDLFHQGTPEGYARAADAFRKASALKPDRCEYALNLAQSLLFLAAEQALNWEESQPRQTEAAAIADRMNDSCVTAYEPFLLRLRSLIRGQGPTAAEFMNRAIDLDSNDAMNWLVLGYVDPTSSHLVTASGSGRWVAVAHAVQLFPGSALLQYEFGKNYQYLRGKEADAKHAFERAAELNPRHFRAYLGLAYSADENTDVEPLFTKVVEIAPAFLEGRTALGSYYASLEEIAKASEQYNAALALNPRYDIAHFRLGLLLLDSERQDEAESHFKAVVDLNSANHEAPYYLGNISFARKDFDAARNRYEQALKIRTNYAEAEYGIGHVYRQQGLDDLALAQFDKVLKLQPRYGDAYLSRGDIHAQRRQFSEALANYKQAIECYEDQVKMYNAAIALAATHPQSRVMQSEKRRNERLKTRIEALLTLARNVMTEIESSLEKAR